MYLHRHVSSWILLSPQKGGDHYLHLRKTKKPRPREVERLPEDTQQIKERISKCWFPKQLPHAQWVAFESFPACDYHRRDIWLFYYYLFHFSSWHLHRLGGLKSSKLSHWPLFLFENLPSPSSRCHQSLQRPSLKTFSKRWRAGTHHAYPSHSSSQQAGSPTSTRAPPVPKHLRALSLRNPCPSTFLYANT